jgi:hypothetical protein
MKKFLVVSSVMVLLIGVTAFTAVAAQFDGSISFAGNTVLDDNDLTVATEFTSFANVFVTAVSGAYSGIPTGAPPPVVTYTPFVFRPVSVPPTLEDLWTFNFPAGTTYSFDATSMVVAFSNANNIVVQGSGIGFITGFDPTPGTWSVTANSAGGTFSFSGGSSTVPEPGVLLLLGCGLVGVAAVRRKFKK